MTKTSNTAWAIKWEGASGVTALLSRYAADVELPDCVSGNDTMLFTSRNKARDFINEKYGNEEIARTLKGTPVEWKAPKPVQVTVTISDGEKESHIHPLRGFLE